jgi:hypothetical protein
MKPHPTPYTLHPIHKALQGKREDSKMGKIKNNSQGRKRNPLGVLTALLLIGFSTLFFTPIQLYAQGDPLDTWTPRC